MLSRAKFWRTTVSRSRDSTSSGLKSGRTAILCFAFYSPTSLAPGSPVCKRNLDSRQNEGMPRKAVYCATWADKFDRGSSLESEVSVAS